MHSIELLDSRLKSAQARLGSTLEEIDRLTSELAHEQQAKEELIARIADYERALKKLKGE